MSEYTHSHKIVFQNIWVARWGCFGRLFLSCAAVFFICGCAGTRHAVPHDLLQDAKVSGMRDIRAFSGSPSDSFKEDFAKLLEGQEDNSSFFNPGKNQLYCVLAISGGGANGAYGAGLLKGWTQAGTRPVFKIVTGISTGAIIAPFAFLGRKYDNRLEEFYTKYSTKNLLSMRIPLSNLFFNNQRMKQLIDRYFDAELLNEIAIEYNNGRRLYVGTTNLDAQRLVIWDMGKIASIGGEKALALFRKVILASVSMPITFPPVYLNVEVGGKVYNEMHVDGGISKQVFFIYDLLQGLDKAGRENGINISGEKYSIYVIRNGYVEPVYKPVQDSLSAITESTVDTITNYQAVGDLYQLYVFTIRNKGDFNLAYIPASHVSRAEELFDPVEMRTLFDLGFKQASRGYPWRKTPPGIRETIK